MKHTNKFKKCGFLCTLLLCLSMLVCSVNVFAWDRATHTNQWTTPQAEDPKPGVNPSAWQRGTPSGEQDYYQTNTYYESYYSESMGVNVTYFVSLPQDWFVNGKGSGKDNYTKYPVVYCLHFLEGDARAGLIPANSVRTASDNGTIPPTIAVSVNSTGNSYYLDSVDGTVMADTTIMEELIPHIEETYGAIPSGNSRALTGFSMGGYGCYQLAFTHPESFAAIAPMAADLHDAGNAAGIAGSEQRPHLVHDVFQGDYDAFEDASPFGQLKKNSDAIADPENGVKIRAVVGARDFTYGMNIQMHAWLNYFGIPHDFLVDPNFDHGGYYWDDYFGNSLRFLSYYLTYDDGETGAEKGVVLPETTYQEDSDHVPALLSAAFDPARNLTPSATARYSSSEYTVGELSDDLDWTYWMWSRSGNEDIHWAELDFGRMVKIDGYCLETGVGLGFPASSFQIQYLKGTEWVDIAGGVIPEYNIWNQIKSPIQPVITDRVRIANIRRTHVNKLSIYGEDYVLEDIGSTGENIAAQATIQACSNSGAASNIIDANAETHWVNTDDVAWTTTTHTVELDFGSVREIEGVMVRSGTDDKAPLEMFEIKAWDDSTNSWIGIGGGYAISNTEKDRYMPFTASIKTSKLQLSSRTYSGTYTYVREIEVYEATTPEQAAPAPDPNKPVIYSATHNNEAVLLLWNAIENVSSYDIYRDGIKIDDTAALFYLDDGLSMGATHTYTVVANGISSDEITVTLSTAYPPERVIASGVFANQVELSWRLPTLNSANFSSLKENQVESVVPQDGFVIYRNGAYLDTVDGYNVSTYIDTSVQPNTAYTYTITGYIGQVESAPCKAVKITTPAAEDDENIALFKPAQYDQVPTSAQYITDGDPDSYASPSNGWLSSSYTVDLLEETPIDKIVIEGNVDGYKPLTAFTVEYYHWDENELYQTYSVVPGGEVNNTESTTVTLELDEPIYASKLNLYFPSASWPQIQEIKVYRADVAVEGVISAPRKLNAYSKTHNSIGISWEASKTSDIDGYNIYLDETFVEKVDPSELTYEFKNLLEDTAYKIGVSAVSGAEESVIASITAKTTVLTLTGALDLEVVDSTQNAITLSWKSISYATAYEIYRDDVLIDTVTDATTYVDTTITDTFRKDCQTSVSATYKVKATASASVITSKEVTAKTLVNVAQGKVVSTSAKKDGAYGYYLTDGDFTTDDQRWQSGEKNADVIIDLGTVGTIGENGEYVSTTPADAQSYMISAFALYSGANNNGGLDATSDPGMFRGIRAYDVYTSMDGVTWQETPVASYDVGEGVVQYYVTFALDEAIEARYVKFSCTGMDQNCRGYEFQVFAPPAPPKVVYYTVSFDANGKAAMNLPDDQSIIENGFATKPENPSCDGFVFVGWYKDAEGTTAWNFNTDIVTSTTTLYAKWAEATGPRVAMTIFDNGWQNDFYSEYGVLVETQMPKYGQNKVLALYRDGSAWPGPSDSILCDMKWSDIEAIANKQENEKVYVTFFMSGEDNANINVNGEWLSYGLWGGWYWRSKEITDLDSNISIYLEAYPWGYFNQVQIVVSSEEPEAPELPAGMVAIWGINSIKTTNSGADVRVSISEGKTEIPAQTKVLVAFYNGSSMMQAEIIDLDDIDSVTPSIPDGATAAKAFMWDMETFTPIGLGKSIDL